MRYWVAMMNEAVEAEGEGGRLGGHEGGELSGRVRRKSGRAMTALS